MRGALLITVVIATLIVGMLVIKNMRSDSGANGGDVTKKEAIQHAEEAARDVQKKIDAATDKLNQSF